MNIEKEKNQTVIINIWYVMSNEVLNKTQITLVVAIDHELMYNNI